jgi:hypothetical protein
MSEPWSRFIDEPIEVTVSGTVREPAAITWRGAGYAVDEILNAWSDWGFPQGAVRRNWRTRRHRNYFRVRTSDGRIFEIYLDRGTKPGREAWFLLRELGLGPQPNAST